MNSGDQLSVASIDTNVSTRVLTAHEYKMLSILNGDFPDEPWGSWWSPCLVSLSSAGLCTKGPNYSLTPLGLAALTQKVAKERAESDAAQQTELAWMTPDLDWPNDGVANIPKTPDDPRAILRDMIDQGLVDRTIGGYLHVMLEAYRRGVIKL
jgi:hypothetical protein